MMIDKKLVYTGTDGRLDIILQSLQVSTTKMRHSQIIIIILIIIMCIVKLKQSCRLPQYVPQLVFKASRAGQ
jgi:hypothetical protein